MTKRTTRSHNWYYEDWLCPYIYILLNILYYNLPLLANSSFDCGAASVSTMQRAKMIITRMLFRGWLETVTSHRRPTN